MFGATIPDPAASGRVDGVFASGARSVSRVAYSDHQSRLPREAGASAGPQVADTPHPHQIDLPPNIPGGPADRTPPPHVAGAIDFNSHRSPAGSCPDDSRAGPDAPLAPGAIPGYRIDRALGHGGMGTVYLARQLSLDRPVALKVMSKRWAVDPVFLARFTREAYAAALLNHPNVVQIYDIGEAAGARFFSMEYVPGRSLAELVRTGGKIDPETAVGFVLQAARGLKHAHERGMIHRDVKPDNLILSDQGVVKVADLGLVKTPEMTREADVPGRQTSASASGLHTLPPNMTGARTALGTPAYMAPEQCRDAATVDHRADVYSLGCTLYALVTGRQPFDGNTAVELMTKHAYEPLVPPETLVTRVPKELSAVIQKMMAKSAGDRYATMGEVIRVLEQWLGVHHHTGTFSPRDEQIDQFEGFVRAFEEAPVAVFRARTVTGVISTCVLAAVLLTFFGKLGWAFGTAGMVVQAALAYFVLNGVARKTYFFRRVRQFASGLTAGDLAVGAAGVGLFAVLLWVLNLFWMWVGFGLIGTGLAFALRVALDRTIDGDRATILAGCEQLLRRLRLNGLDEEEIRQFVAKYAGRNWEEFFEALFGFEAKLAARGVLLRGGSAGVREKFAPWREPIVNLIDRVERARAEARERKMLQRSEQARLQAAGVSEPSARTRAAAAAAAMVGHARAIRSAPSPVNGASPGFPSLSQITAQSGSYTAVAAQDGPPPRWSVGRLLVTAVVGPHVRGGVAAVLVAACTLWVVQNRLFTDASFAAATNTTHQTAVAVPTTEDVPADDTPQLPGRTWARPLTIEGVAPEWTNWCDTANVGWGGILLLVSLFFRGNRMALMVLLGAAVTVLGHRFGIRTVEPIRDYHVSFLLGTVFALIGYRLGDR